MAVGLFQHRASELALTHLRMIELDVGGDVLEEYPAS